MLRAREVIREEDLGVLAKPLKELYQRRGTTDTAAAVALQTVGVRVTGQYYGQIRSGTQHNSGFGVRGLGAHFDLPLGVLYQAGVSRLVMGDPVVKAVRSSGDHGTRPARPRAVAARPWPLARPCRAGSQEGHRRRAQARPKIRMWRSRLSEGSAIRSEAVLQRSKRGHAGAQGS